MLGQLPPWVIYTSMPIVGAIIGYVTKLVAVEMMFRPLRFVGIPPVLGWQGVVPRFAPRIATVAVDLMLAQLLSARELVHRIDSEELAARLEEPVRRAIDDVVCEFMTRRLPLIWEDMGESGRKSVISAVQGRAPKLLRRLVADLKADPDSVLDLRHIAFDALTRDPALLVGLVRRVGHHELKFVVKIGAPFGAFLGAAQAVAWAMTHNEWVVPAFGAFTGYFTDWLALQMIFRPVAPRRYLGIRWQGLFHRRRDCVVSDYAELIGTEILSPENLVEAVLTGPQADRLIAFVTRELDVALGPLLVIAGGSHYQETRTHIVTVVLDRMRASLDQLGDYTAHAMDIRGTLVAKMAVMTDEEYEGLLRPAFKQDEWKLVSVGAVLGFLIGELQVLLLLH